MSAVCNADAGLAAGTTMTSDLNSAVHPNWDRKRMLRGTDGYNEAAQEERGFGNKVGRGIKKAAKAVGKGVKKSVLVIKDAAEDAGEWVKAQNAEAHRDMAAWYRDHTNAHTFVAFGPR